MFRVPQGGTQEVELFLFDIYNLAQKKPYTVISHSKIKTKNGFQYLILKL